MRSDVKHYTSYEMVVTILDLKLWQALQILQNSPHLLEVWYLRALELLQLPVGLVSASM